MKKLILTSLLLIAFGSNAQDFDKPKLDSLLSLIDDNQKGMGSLSIFENGKEVYQHTIGYASIKDSIKSDQSTKYRIGSISKTFTTSIVLELIEEQKLTLDTRSLWNGCFSSSFW